MRYMKQFSIILLIALLGELVHNLLPLPVPASIYGLILLLIALNTKLIPLDAVEDVSNFLIEIMPLMFIPAGVGLMASWDVLSPILVPFLVISLVSTAIVMGCAGKVTDVVLQASEKKHEAAKAAKAAETAEAAEADQEGDEQ